MTKTDEAKTCYFTVCSINYLPQALVLAESLYYHENEKIIIYIVDQKKDIDLSYDFVVFQWIEEQGIPNLKNMAYKYDVQEFNTSVKPYLALKLLEEFSNVIFLDPDICIYNSLERIKKKLNQYSIILTPHYIIPKDENEDMDLMRFGSFNLGFFAVNSTPEARDFLIWWSKRLSTLCYHEPQFGLSTDQKWISIAPCFFPNLHVEFDMGYNVAFWNLHERSLTMQNKKMLINNSSKLIFFHFSNFDRMQPVRVSKRISEKNIVINEELKNLCLSYANKLDGFDKRKYSQVKYTYNYMDNGMYVSPTTRRAFASISEHFSETFNPFEANDIMSKFLKRNYLKVKNNKEYSSLGFKDIKTHKREFKFIYLVLRMLLRIIGPNKFYNLSRLMVFLSSYRQNPDMWNVKASNVHY